MIAIRFCFVPVLILFAVQSLAQQPSHPVAPVRPVIDDYYGTKVVDPSRYMENLSDPEVQAWMKAQNDYARAVLADIPGRSKMRDRLHNLDRSAPAQFQMCAGCQAISISIRSSSSERTTCRSYISATV